MDKELKAKWIEALRSGAYEQGKNVLYNKRENSYCCLGVLAVLRGCSTEQIKGDASASTPKGWGVLPPRTVDYLIDMNDAHNRSFAEIADYIEADL